MKSLKSLLVGYIEGGIYLGGHGVGRAMFNSLFHIFSLTRYAQKRFRKAQCPIVERLVNALMMHGRNNGKKLMAVRIARHAFEIIHLLTGENPLQVLFIITWSLLSP